jgi:hypothetical protein
MYKADADFPVYCHDCWWSDKWNPLDYGRNYNFNISFFEQFAELQNVVPRLALSAIKNSASAYCNYANHNKGCYLLFGSWFSENCAYGQTIMESKDCWDCMFIKNCELCFASLDCNKCSQIYFSQKCSNCVDSMFLFDCRNCQNCLFSYNLRNKNYYIFNKQVSKETFHKTKEKILSSHSALKKATSDFNELVRKEALHKFMTGENNYDVSGEFIYGCKNVHDSYYINDAENQTYAVRGGKGQKDSMDVFGVHAGELAYECNNIDFSSRCFFSLNGESNIDSSYLIDCSHLNNSFGNISVRKKEYCIFNKQYTKHEYDALIEKIIHHMSEIPYLSKGGEIYKYGEFFPFELSPHKYNESIAQEYIPLSKKEALRMNYSWNEVEEKNYVPTKNWNDLPDTTEGVDDKILSEIILCEAWDLDKELAQNHKCTKAFKITPNELIMYRKLHMPLPRKCPNTRNFEMSQLRNLVNFWDRKCMCNKTNHIHRDGSCDNEFKTSYSPNRPEIIYCEKCYQQEVY